MQPLTGRHGSQQSHPSGGNTCDAATTNAANLVEQMETVNERRNLVNRLPNETEVYGWIEETKALPRQVNY